MSHYVDRSNRTFRVFLYFLFLFFIGLGCIAILPAFEGLDEVGHFSSVRQIADTGTIPLRGTGFIDEAIWHYQGPGPDIPDYHFPSYKTFFSQPNAVENYISSYREASLPAFRPSQVPNYETQHPPLFYMLLAPAAKLTEHLPFLTQLFSLRLASFLIALVGVGLGLMAIRTGDEPATMGFMLYPLVFPMFFAEFARIGNDSLCILLVGLTAYLLSKWLRDEDSARLSVSIGVVLGLGLLTKAFFLPIIAALSTFLVARTWPAKNTPDWVDREAFLRNDPPPQDRDRRHRHTRVRDRCDTPAGPRPAKWLGLPRALAHWKSLVMLFLPALLIGGGWYAYQFVAFGSPTGSVEAIYLDTKGGMIAGLRQNFSVYALFRGSVAFFKSYVWASSQSLAKLPAVLFIPTMVLLCLSFGAFLLRLRHLPFKDVAWLPVLMLAFFGAGFFYHMLLVIAAVGKASTPGWYLHILMPWLAPAFGVGLNSLFQIRQLKPLVVGLLIYALLFDAVAVWAQLAFFAGCAIKTEDSFYAFTGSYFCLDQFALVVGRVNLLGWPLLAIIGFGGGFLCGSSLLWISRVKVGAVGGNPIVRSAIAS